MKSVRLTYALRRAIQRKATEAVFGEQIAEMEAASRDFEVQILDAMRDRGVPMAPMTNFYIRLRPFESGPVWTRWFYRDVPIDAPRNVVIDAELYARAIAFQQREQKLERAKQMFDSKVNDLLRTVTTTKRLATVWPQAKDFIPEAVTVDPPVDPAKQLVSDLTEIMLDAGMELEE